MFTVKNCAQISIEFIEMVSGRSYFALSWLDTKLERKELMDDKEGEKWDGVGRLTEVSNLLNI
jgi:hypothetical protein